ncbi:hypothetical protein Bbelb_417390 [Branchiostoma belcheri]|nr:hypothetical protein Bbelb_417390 [Branchiostoma belcheri]
MESVGTAGAALCAPAGLLAPGPGLSDKTFPSWTWLGDGRVNVRVLTTGNLEADGEARQLSPACPTHSPEKTLMTARLDSTSRTDNAEAGGPVRLTPVLLPAKSGVQQAADNSEWKTEQEEKEAGLRLLMH